MERDLKIRDAFRTHRSACQCTRAGQPVHTRGSAVHMRVSASAHARVSLVPLGPVVGRPLTVAQCHLDRCRLTTA
eukprot:1481237-Rhodomonas_salina.1